FERYLRMPDVGSRAAPGGARAHGHAGHGFSDRARRTDVFHQEESVARTREDALNCPWTGSEEDCSLTAVQFLSREGLRFGALRFFAGSYRLNALFSSH